jgi:hypothetical protein
MKKLIVATLAVAIVFGAGNALAANLFIKAADVVLVDPLDPASAVDASAPADWQTTYQTQSGSFDNAIRFWIGIFLDPAGGDMNAAEFTLLYNMSFTGVLAGDTTLLPGALDLGDSAGEFILGLGGCWNETIEALRTDYLNFSGAIPQDHVLADFGGVTPSSFGGEPGISTCGNQPGPLTLGGADGGSTANVSFPDGACVLNPSSPVVPNDASSMGSLKARY